MDNSIFVLSEMDENFYADKDVDNIIAVIIFEAGYIWGVDCTIGKNTYPLQWILELECDNKMYSYFEGLVCIPEPAYHQEVYFTAYTEKLGRCESPHFFIDIEPFFKEIGFR